MKIKLSVYNTILMSIMVFLVLFFMINISGSVIKVSSEQQLKSVVNENAEEIEYKKDELDFSDIEFYEDQVTTLVYSNKGKLIAGHTRNEILEPLIDGQVKTIIQDNEEYLIYDLLYVSRYTEDVYLRGIISTSSVSQMLNRVFLIAIITLPLFIIISSIGSYLICKNSLKPLEKMVKTAEDIIASDDLTLRIKYKNGKDEISRLSIAFDNMLDRIEHIYLREKEFTSDVSHELRTPTAVILAECEIADKNESIEVINLQAKKIKQIINNLLKLIRLENGIEKVEIEEVDLSELFEVICDEYENILPENIKFKIDIAENIKFRLDYAMISRVLTNLIDNSIKYIGEGDFIEIILSENETEIEFSVKDNGIGIDSENISKIFERFYRVDKSRTESDSMGLGLSMVKQMIELNNGQIKVESEINKGSKFIITFNKGE